MKNKFIYDTKNIKLCSILILINIIVNVINPIIHQISYIMSNDLYVSAKESVEFVFSTLLTTLLIFIPELICVAVFIYNKFKPERALAANKLLRIYALTAGCVKLFSFCYYLSIGYIDSFLDVIIYNGLLALFLLLLGIFVENKKVFSVSRIALPIIIALYAAWSLYNYLYVFVGSSSDLKIFAVCSLISNVLAIARICILLFRIFKQEPSANELLENLNKDYNSGKISKEDYDSERQKIINSI